MVKIKVGNVSCQILDLDNLVVIDAISKALTYTLDSAKYTFQYRTGNWDGSQKLLTKALKFPAGLLDSVLGVLSSFDISPELEDERQVLPYGKLGTKWGGHKLHDYQNSIVERALIEKRGMVQAATGAGKATIIGRLAYEYNLPTVIYVVSLDLLGQMHSDLNKWLGVPVGMVGGGVCDIQKITVCSAWTVGKAFLKKKAEGSGEEDVKEDKWDPSEEQSRQIKEMAQNAQLVILDEAQFAAATSIKVILENSKAAPYRFGFSGTPWRTGGDDLLLEAAFGKKIVKIGASELIEKGFLVQPKIGFRDIPSYHTNLPKKWKAVQSNYIVNNEVRNMVLISNTIKLLEMGRKPLILFREHKHGELLRDMIPDDVRVRYVTGKLDKEDRDDIRDSFKAGDVDLILASVVYDQGVDLPNLDALVLAGGGKSTAKALQRVGRVIRSNPGSDKKDAFVVDTFDQCHFVKSHSMARYSIYKTEERFMIKVGDSFSDFIKRGRW